MRTFASNQANTVESDNIQRDLWHIPVPQSGYKVNAFVRGLRFQRGFGVVQVIQQIA